MSPKPPGIVPQTFVKHPKHMKKKAVFRLDCCRCSPRLYNGINSFYISQVINMRYVCFNARKCDIDVSIGFE